MKMLKNIRTAIKCIECLPPAREKILQTPSGLFSTVPSKTVRNQNKWKFLPKEDFQAYMSYLPKFINDVTSKNVLLGYEEVNRRMQNVLEYMGPNGKHLRQHLMIYTYQAVQEHYQPVASKNIEEVHKLCWCLELLNKSNTILDDFLDEHEFRGNVETWTKKEGKSAIMDLQLIRISLRGVLKMYFEHHPRFKEIVDLIFRPETLVALALELETKNIETFTMRRWEDIAMMKTVFYVSELPFTSATLLANNGLHINGYATKALRYLGLLYQMQNDLIDVYGESIAGKPCSDIENNRCTYLIAMALEKASNTQKTILLEHYGKQDQNSVDKVKEIYEELDILGHYSKVEKQYLEKTSEEIRRIPDEFARSLIEKIAYVQSYGEIGVPPY